MRLFLSALLIPWTIFMLVQVVQTIAEYGIYSMLLVMLEIVVWYAIAWFPIWLLTEID